MTYIRPTRRAVIAGLGAALAAPTVLRAQDAGRRTFRIFRDGSDIGFHTIALSRSGSEIQAAIEIEIKVKLLGITAYRYEMTNREVWRAGRLVGLNSTVNDDGDKGFANAKADGDRLIVEGSGYNGEAPADAATTSYWAKDFLQRPTWISTQTGLPLKVSTAKRGAGTVPSANGDLTTEEWAVTGDIDLALHYVGPEWASVAFDAGGETAIYAPDTMGPALSPVWDAAL